MMENINIREDKLRENYPKHDYDIIDSIGLVALLNSYKVYPCALDRNENSNFTSCIYLRDDNLYQELATKWYDGYFDDLKLFNKSFAKCKKAFVTKNLEDFRR